MRIIFYIFAFFLGEFFAQFFLTGCSEKKVKDFEGAIGKAVEQYSFVDEEKSEEKVTVPPVEEVKPEIEEPVDLPPVNDLDCVNIWQDRSVKNWPTTVKLDVTIDKSKMYFTCDKMDWPAFGDTKPVNGNIWIIVERGGQVYATTWEWFRGQKFAKDRSKLQDDAPGHMHGDWSGWSPKEGEKLGFFLSGRVRDGGKNAEERTNISWVRW